MASGSKLFPRTKNRIGTKFFVDTFFFFLWRCGAAAAKKMRKNHYDGEGLKTL